MDLTNNIISMESSKPVTKSRKRFVRSLEYELIASLTLNQYELEGEPNYKGLLSIPLDERIPGLMQEYGLKRMHKLVKTILQEFCYSIALPKSKKLTDTKISVVACDLILSAHEDQLSMEDLIVFFERAKQGKYGKFKSLLTHYAIMEKLEVFRQQRYEAYQHMKAEREAELKLLGGADRISPEPTSIRTLFEQQEAKVIPFRKIS